MKIARGFHERANFPNCIGAIDGKHIRIIKPKDSGSRYYNYKSYFSVVLLAICDADYTRMFTFLDIGFLLLLLLSLYTAIGFSPGGNSPYTSTHNTNGKLHNSTYSKYKYTH
jgi:hypothetical protein